MQIKLNPKYLYFFEYAGYRVKIYLKSETEKAVAFRIFNPKGGLTKQILWLPKSVAKREGREIIGIDWIFDEEENRSKLEKSGYRL